MSQWVQFEKPSEALQALRELVLSNPNFSTREVLFEIEIAMLDRNRNKNACYITARSNELVKALLSSNPLRDHHVVEDLPPDNKARGVLELYREATFKASGEHASHAVLVDTQQSEQSYKRMLDSVSRFPGYQMEYLRLEDFENPEIQLRGVKLIAVGHTKVELPLTIAGQRILRLCGRNLNVGIPIAKTCPFIEQFEFLLPDLKGNEILLRLHEKQQWRKWKMSTLKLADTITFASPPTEIVEYNTLDQDYLNIAPEFVYDGSRRTREAFTGNLIECIRTERGKGNPRLLELFDHIEANSLQNATYYVKRRQDEGENPLADVWHYIKYSVEDAQLPILYSSIRFVQPAVFARENLPIYLESGFKFKPDITNMLETLPKDHSLFRQLKSICEKSAEEDAVFIIEGPKNNQTPKPRKLVNGRPLLDSLGGIDFLKDELSTINLSAESELLFDAKISVDGFRQEYINELMVACDIEEKAIADELTEVLASLDNEVKVASDKCDSLNTQKNQIKELANQFEKVINKDSIKIWDELLNIVIKALDEMAAPRRSWIMEESQRVLNQEKVLDSKLINLRDIAKEIGANVATLNVSLDQCKKQKTAIDTLEKKAQNAKVEFDSLDTEGTKKIGEIRSELKEWLNKIIAREADLKRQTGELKQLHEELSRRNTKILREEQENARWSEKLKSQSDSIDSRIEAAKIEKERLEDLEQVVIPRKTIDKDRKEFELSEIQKHDYDTVLRKLSSDLAQVTNNLTQAKVKRDSAREQEDDLATKKDQLITINNELKKCNSRIPALKATVKKLEEDLREYQKNDVKAEFNRLKGILLRLKVLKERAEEYLKDLAKLDKADEVRKELQRYIKIAEQLAYDMEPDLTMAHKAGRAISKLIKRYFKKK